MNVLPYFEDRAEAVLAFTFRGMHNVPGKVKKLEHRWEVICFSSLATFDFDQLTRLVLAAHEHYIRIEVQPCNMQNLRLLLHPRVSGRHGAIYERHPNLEELSERIEKMRQPQET